MHTASWTFRLTHPSTHPPKKEATREAHARKNRTHLLTYNCKKKKGHALTRTVDLLDMFLSKERIYSQRTFCGLANLLLPACAIRE